MTKEQAINYLYSSGMSEEQVKTVVEALEQEPSGDLISREQALSSAKCIFESDSKMKAFSMIKMLEELPSFKQDCDTCEIGNPCLYCKHEFEPQENETNLGG